MLGKTKEKKINRILFFFEKTNRTRAVIKDSQNLTIVVHMMQPLLHPPHPHTLVANKGYIKLLTSKENLYE